MPQKTKRKGFGLPTRKSGNSGIQLMHPFVNVSFPTDRYYDDIALRLVPKLALLSIELGCDPDLLSRMALSVAAYFEDQVSGLGIWAAFTHRHHDLYGKWLPWYDTTSDDADYYEDEVNLQDIKFLLWMISVSTQEGSYIPPQNSTIEECATDVFEFLMDQFEKAPINQDLVNLLYSDKLTDDFYQLKKVLIWLTQDCYLMAVPSWQGEIRQRIRDAICNSFGREAKSDWVNFFEASYASMRMRIGPLALFAKEWYVLMRQQKGLTKDNDKILNIDSTPYYPFIVVSNNGDTLTLRSVRDKVYMVDSYSFNLPSVKDFKGGEILYTMLANYDGVWRMNGTMSGIQMERGKDSNEWLKDMATKLQKNTIPVDLFGMFDTSVKRNANSKVRERMDKLIAQNNGRRLFYFPNPMASLKWQETFYDCPLDPEEVKAFKKHYYEDDLMMAYIMKDYSFRTLTQANTINDPNNPFYNPKDAYLASELLYSKNKYLIPDEFVAYLIENNCLEHLNFNTEKEDEINAKLISDNLRFWATFMRQYPF